MSDQKNHKLKGNLGKVYKAVRQSRKGIRAVEIAEKLSLDRTTVHPHLRSLRLRGLVKSDQGIWHAITGEQTIRPLEKEIVIELPIPENQWQRIASLEVLAKDYEKSFPEPSNLYRVCLEKLRETRTIRIKGKNVDDLDLEKIGNLIQQANEKSSKINLKGLLKRLRR